MPCFRDEDLVLYAESRAPRDLAQQIESHLQLDACRLCGAFVAWLRQVLPELPHAFDLAPRALIAKTVAGAARFERPAPLEVEMMRELTAVPEGVRNLASDERVYQLGSHRLELSVQASLHPPFLDVVGLIDPEPPAGTEVILLAEDQLPIDSQAPDASGRFAFAQLARGVYEIQVQIPGESARRTPPFEVRI